MNSKQIKYSEYQGRYYYEFKSEDCDCDPDRYYYDSGNEDCDFDPDRYYDISAGVKPFKTRYSCPTDFTPPELKNFPINSKAARKARLLISKSFGDVCYRNLIQSLPYLLCFSAPILLSLGQFSTSNHQTYQFAATSISVSGLPSRRRSVSESRALVAQTRASAESSQSSFSTDQALASQPGILRPASESGPFALARNSRTVSGELRRTSQSIGEVRVLSPLPALETVSQEIALELAARENFITDQTVPLGLYIAREQVNSSATDLDILKRLGDEYEEKVSETSDLSKKLVHLNKKLMKLERKKAKEERRKNPRAAVLEGLSRDMTKFDQDFTDQFLKLKVLNKEAASRRKIFLEKVNSEIERWANTVPTEVKNQLFCDAAALDLDLKGYRNHFLGKVRLIGASTDLKHKATNYVKVQVEDARRGFDPEMRSQILVQEVVNRFPNGPNDQRARKLVAKLGSEATEVAIQIINKVHAWGPGSTSDTPPVSSDELLYSTELAKLMYKFRSLNKNANICHVIGTFLSATDVFRNNPIPGKSISIDPKLKYFKIDSVIAAKARQLLSAPSIRERIFGPKTERQQLVEDHINRYMNETEVAILHHIDHYHRGAANHSNNAFVGDQPGHAQMHFADSFHRVYRLGKPPMTASKGVATSGSRFGWYQNNPNEAEPVGDLNVDPEVSGPGSSQTSSQNSRSSRRRSRDSSRESSRRLTVGPEANSSNLQNAPSNPVHSEVSSASGQDISET